jgi:hypothetical protein
MLLAKPLCYQLNPYTTSYVAVAACAEPAGGRAALHCLRGPCPHRRQLAEQSQDRGIRGAGAPGVGGEGCARPALCLKVGLAKPLCC